jgi:hypothetical protein
VVMVRFDCFRQLYCSIHHWSESGLEFFRGRESGEKVDPKRSVVSQSQVLSRCSMATDSARSLTSRQIFSLYHSCIVTYVARHYLPAYQIRQTYLPGSTFYDSEIFRL